MPKFYYIYGPYETMPFKGGWTEISAVDRASADTIFRAIHPNTVGEDTSLNCAITYTEKEFKMTKMYEIGKQHSFGCHERIKMDISKDTKDKYVLSGDFGLINVVTSNLSVYFEVVADEDIYRKIYENIHSYEKRTKNPAYIEFEDISNKIKHLCISSIFGDRDKLYATIIYKDDTASLTYCLFRAESRYIAKRLRRLLQISDTDHIEKDDYDAAMDVLKKYLRI